MKIFWSEIYKLITTPIFIFTVAVAIIFSLYSAAITQADTVSDNDYRTFFSDISEISSMDEQCNYIENTLSDLLVSGEANLEWRKKVNFYRSQLEQAQSIADYESYLENIHIAAKSMKSVSIFADKDSYTYRNITKTPSAYEECRDVTPVFTPSAGILLAVDNRVEDIVFIFALISAVIVLIGKERESKIISLIKPLKKGREILCVAKIMSVFTITVAIYAVIFIGTLVIGELKFGLGDIFRPIQSVEGFMGCNLPISVLQMLIIIFIIKVLTAFIIAMIFQCLCTKLSVTVSIIIFSIATFVQVLMYSLVKFSSSAAPLAALNLVAFMDSGNIFKMYKCINVFGYPVNYFSLVIACILVGIIATTFVAVYLFSHINISANRKIKIPLPFSQFIPKKAFLYSAYKYLVTHKGILIIVIVSAIQIYNAVTFNVSYNTDDGYYKSYCNTLSTMNSEQAERFIVGEEERYDLLLSTLLSPDCTANEVIQISRALNAKTGFEQAKEQYYYITNLSSENKGMFYLSGWNELFGVNGYKSDMTLMLIVVLALSLMILPCIAYDNKCRLGVLINTTKLGKNAYYKHNFIISSIFGIVIAGIVCLTHFYSILSFYGCNGVDKSIRCLSMYENFVDMPIWSYLTILFIARSLISVLLSIVLVWISSASQTPSVAILIGCVLFVLPVLIYLAGYNLAMYFCVPFIINNVWLDKGFATNANLIVFLGLSFYSLVCRFSKK